MSETMTLVQMANDLQAIIDGDRPRLNKTEMREYVHDLLAANAAHLATPAQTVDVGVVKRVIADLRNASALLEGECNDLAHDLMRAIGDKP